MNGRREGHLGLLWMRDRSSLLVATAALAGVGGGILAWAIGRADLAKMNAGTMDDEGRGSAQGGMICGIIGTVLSALALLACVGLIAFMVASGP